MGRKFWRRNSFGSKFLGRKFGEQIFWGGIFASQISFWEQKNTGEQKCFGEEIYGEQKFLGAKYFWEEKFGKQNLGSKTFFRIQQTQFSYSKL